MKIYWNGERKNVIGSRVKELRKKQNISQKILAARLSLSGIDFTELTILRIEKGIRFVPDYYFHVTSDYLLGRTSKE
jgi:DNA-binding XRE family transcriptional regulator